MPDEPERILGVLALLREELRRSYPVVDRGALLRVLRGTGLTSWPEAFLVRRAPSGGVLAALYRRIGGAHGAPTHPLFSPRYYELANPDVAAGRVDPWLHYQVLGRLEGRSPHPFLDPRAIARLLDGEPLATAVDRYLTEPRLWALQPGPYVDVESFVAEGPWDGHTHPLVQILRDYPTDPWVRLRLGAIDLGSVAAPDALALGAGILSLRNTGLAAVTGLSSWTRSGGAPVTPGESLRVVPGFFVGGAAGEVAATGRAVLSADATVVRTPELVVALDVGPERRCDRLLFLAAELPVEQIDRCAVGVEDLVAPATEAQAAHLARLGLDSLPLGRQATVVARRVDVVADPDGVTT